MGAQDRALQLCPAGYPSLLANEGGVFKMLGYTRGESLAEIRAIMID